MMAATEELDPPALSNLLAFHRSIRASLEVFDETASLASIGLVDVVKASALYDFFVGPMQWHDEDEGRSLLPRLLRADPARFNDVVAACRDEHTRMEATLASVLLHLREVSFAGAEPDPELLRAAALQLREVLEPHLHREETAIFPAARRLLTTADLDEMTSEMRARRLRRMIKRRGED
ncbi:MAG: hemerythrin domain-containing protein [Deltaproteobacteria bacterium]|nr:hemerythrin domain-containing protein [Deltaproteobacteria bacterium]